MRLNAFSAGRGWHSVHSYSAVAPSSSELFSASSYSNSSILLLSDENVDSKATTRTDMIDTLLTTCTPYRQWYQGLSKRRSRLTSHLARVEKRHVLATNTGSTVLIGTSRQIGQVAISFAIQFILDHVDISRFFRAHCRRFLRIGRILCHQEVTQLRLPLRQGHLRILKGYESTSGALRYASTAPWFRSSVTAQSYFNEAHSPLAEMVRVSRRLPATPINLSRWVLCEEAEFHIIAVIIQKLELIVLLDMTKQTRRNLYHYSFLDAQ